MSFSQGEGDLHHSEILYQAIPSVWSKGIVCKCTLYFSVPLCPSSLLTHWHRSNMLLRHSRPNHPDFYEPFPNSYRLLTDSSSLPTLLFSQSDYNWRQRNLALSIIQGVCLITGLKIENTVDCNVTEPSGWNYHVSRRVLNKLWPNHRLFDIKQPISW